MLYQSTQKPLSLIRWFWRVATPIRARQVTDIRELSPYLRADIGALDVTKPPFL